MKAKFVRTQLNEEEPVALAVLGAPAGGKGYTMNKIKDVTSDIGVKQTMTKGKELTIDKLRAEFLSKDPHTQLIGFVRAFYLMKKKAKSDPEEYGKWFKEISNMWSEKFAKLMPSLKISIKDNNLLFNGEFAYKAINQLKKIDAAKVIGKLDRYTDYKRVTRYFQTIKQTEAINKMMGISYDETGDEPKKILNVMTNLHNKKYVTDVFLIHPENVATNLIQNFYRVLTGDDGGRDSSDNIIDTYLDIEKSKHLYKNNAEKNLKIKSSDLNKVNEPLKDTTIKDDKQRGNKPIDLFMQVNTMKPNEAFNKFNEKLDEPKQTIFKALLRYSAHINNIPEEAKNTLISLSKMSNKTAYEVLRRTAKSKKFVFKIGGITYKLVNKARKLMFK